MRKKRDQFRMLHEMKRAIAAAYERGEAVQVICERFKVGRSTPWLMAEKFGVPCRKNGAARKSLSLSHDRRRSMVAHAAKLVAHVSL